MTLVDCKLPPKLINEGADDSNFNSRKALKPHLSQRKLGTMKLGRNSSHNILSNTN